MGVPEEGFYQPRVKPKHRCPMTKELLWVRKELLAKILKHPCSLPFKHPVDAITEGIYPGLNTHLIITLFRCHMTKELLWVRKELLAKILKHPCSLPFKHPVPTLPTLNTPLINTLFRCPMTKELLWVRKELLAKILKHPCSLPFKHPVDAITEGIYPDYFMVVQHPMDLYTVKSRLDHGWYWSLDACLADINLVWKNARLYNPADHPLHEWAVKLKEFTNKNIRRWKRNNNMEKRKRSKSSSQEPTNPQNMDNSHHTTDRVHVKTNFHDIRVCEELLNKIMRETGRQPLMSDGEEGSSPLHEGNTSPRMNEDLNSPRRMDDSRSPMRIEDDAPSSSPTRTESTRLDLETLERKLKTGHYHQAEQFANDFRRMISETYRNCAESDPLVEQAKELHHKFEYEYAHCLLTDEETMHDSEKEEEESKVLEGIMNNAVQIENQLNRLIQDEDSRLKELKVDDLAVQRREEAKQLVLQISVMDSTRIAEIINIMQMEDAGGEAMQLEGEDGEDEDTLTLDFEKMTQKTINHLKQYVNSVV